MPSPMFRSALCLLVGVCVAPGLPTGAQAGPITTIGELAGWDPNRPGDLPGNLARLDPNAVVIARDTLSVLPDMFTKMETVILNLTGGRTRVRLDELLSSILPDDKAGRAPAAAPVHAFAVGAIAEKLKAGGAKVPVAELEALVAVVEGGPAKALVTDLRKRGTEIPLADLLKLIEKSPAAVRDYFRPTVMAHLEHGRLGRIERLYTDESDDPWSISLGELAERAKTGPKAVQDYVATLPVWLMHFRTTREAPDVPLHQLMEMLASSRAAYKKMVARPLLTEKDLAAPGKVAYMLQEAYARSEQIRTDLAGRTVIGVIAVATLLVLLSLLRGVIKVLDIPNRRIVK